MSGGVLLSLVARLLTRIIESVSRTPDPIRTFHAASPRARVRDAERNGLRRVSIKPSVVRLHAAARFESSNTTVFVDTARPGGKIR